MRRRRVPPHLVTITAAFGSLVAAMQWEPHTVRQLNGAAPEIHVPAQVQIMTNAWNRVVAIPYLVYMPEKRRLLMSVLCDYPQHPMLTCSDDFGVTWSDPTTGGDLGLTYVGNGVLLAFISNLTYIGISRDYGESWDVMPQETSGEEMYAWDPFLVLPGSTGKTERLAQAFYKPLGSLFQSDGGPSSQAYLRFSDDVGRSWSASRKIPQWAGVNEINMIAARNGDWVAACRTGMPKRFVASELDHYCGLGVSVSRDQGKTWSEVDMLYEWGRHHPSMLLYPNGDLIMTYVVRLGYVHTKEGFPQYGIEAVCSRDNGRTWDLDHRYLLYTWVGHRKGRQTWQIGPQATSSVLLPDGHILTAFGTGYRSQSLPNGKYGPRDVGLVLWKPSGRKVNDDRTMHDAPFNSGLRNLFDPTSGKPATSECPEYPHRTTLCKPASGYALRAGRRAIPPFLALSSHRN